MGAIEHAYFVGPNEMRARALIGPPGGGVFDLATLEAYPIPLSEGEAVEAEVSHGRWVARCPFCGGAEAVTAALPVLWCDECRMAEVHGQAVRVHFPADLEAIEAALGQRRQLVRRNYGPDDVRLAAKHGVTVAARLHAENVVHGIVPSTVEQRILAKADYWGTGLVTAELADLEGVGADELERRYHEGG